MNLYLVFMSVTHLFRPFHDRRQFPGVRGVPLIVLLAIVLKSRFALALAAGRAAFRQRHAAAEFLDMG